MTRRGLVARVLAGAGAAGAAALTGCGAPQPSAKRPVDVLSGQLGAERVVQGALGSAPAAQVSGLLARSRARAARLEAAGAGQAAGGTVPSRPDAAYGRLLVTHVEALPLLPPRLRGLAAELLRGAAADQATLRSRAGREPVALPFPGRPRA